MQLSTGRGKKKRQRTEEQSRNETPFPTKLRNSEEATEPPSFDFLSAFVVFGEWWRRGDEEADDAVDMENDVSDLVDGGTDRINLRDLCYISASCAIHHSTSQLDTYFRSFRAKLGFDCLRFNWLSSGGVRFEERGISLDRCRCDLD